MNDADRRSEAQLDCAAPDSQSILRIPNAASNHRINIYVELGVLGEQMKAGQMLMVRLAENQLELKPSLNRLAEVAEGSLGHDDVLRNHMRNIEAYLARLTEDVAQGRAQSVQELRAEIRILARTVAGLAEENRR